MSAPMSPMPPPPSAAPTGDPNDLRQPLRGATFGQAVQRFWKKYSEFNGRASRSEYWFAALANFIAVVVLEILAIAISHVFLILYVVYILAIIVPSLALGARRLHDIGKSGWFQLIGLIPIVGGIILIVWDATAERPEGDRYNL